jgi:hypothetical protein
VFLAFLQILNSSLHAFIFFPWIIFKLVVKFGVCDIFEEIFVTYFKDLIMYISLDQGALLPNFWLQIINFYNLGLQEKIVSPKLLKSQFYCNYLDLY